MRGWLKQSGRYKGKQHWCVAVATAVAVAAVAVAAVTTRISGIMKKKLRDGLD